MQGVDIVTVRELLGHKTLTIKTLRYAHLAPSHKQKAVEVLNNALGFSGTQLVHNLKEKGAAFAR